jgi:DNA-binding transcriptional ArsR family regulator
MSKKTSQAASANDSQDASQPTKTGFTTADKYELKVCRVCGAELTEANWYASYLKLNRYICKKCENERYDHRPFNEDRDCPLFLGIHVAERVLSHVFKDVERMPMHNPGYDFICNRGKKIDVKSACMRGNKASWAFSIHRNTTADYFLCLAFDNRTDLNPLYAWLLPGSKVQHLTAAGVSISTISKWESYRIDISKISKCCDVLKYRIDISKISKCCDVLKNTPKKNSTLEPDTPQKSKTDRDIPKPQKSKTDRDIPKRSTKVKQIATFQKESPNLTQATSQQVLEEVQKRSNNKTPPLTKQVQKTSKPYTTSESLTNTRDSSIKYKKGTKQDTLQNLYLSIITLLKSGIRPSKIHPKLGISKQSLQHHLTALKKQGVIRKVGYGTWEVIDSPESTKMRSTKTIHVAKNTPPSEVRQNLHSSPSKSPKVSPTGIMKKENYISNAIKYHSKHSASSEGDNA